MSDVTTDYETLLDFIVFLGYVMHVMNVCRAEK